MLERHGSYKNFEWVITFDDVFGYRCGYVGIPESHPFYKKYYEDLNIDCHSGLTYSDFIQNAINPKLWYIGFDCNHSTDGIDLESLRRYIGNNAVTERMSMDDYNYRKDLHALTAEEVEDECKHIIDQIIINISKDDQKILKALDDIYDEFGSTQ